MTEVVFSGWRRRRGNNFLTADGLTPRLPASAATGNTRRAQGVHRLADHAQSHQLIDVPASDYECTLDHLAQYITGFFFAFRCF